MPKSRNKKGHKQRVQNYRKRIEDTRRSREKQLRTLYEKQQQEALDNQISSVESQVQETSVNAEINTEDFKLKLPTEPQNEVGASGNINEVIGVSNPSQI